MSLVRERFIPDGLQVELGEETSLLELGVLDSLNTAILLNFVRELAGVPVPTQMIVPENLRDVRSITAMIARLAGRP